MRRRRKKVPPRPRERQIVNVNPSDRNFYDKSYIFWFSVGGYATPHYLRAWGSSMDDALEECVDWIVENAPGVLCDDYMEEEYKRLIAEGASEDEAREEVEQDVTVFGHSGYHGIPSENWGIVTERPSRADVLSLEGREPERRAHGRDPLARRRRAYDDFLLRRRSGR